MVGRTSIHRYRRRRRCCHCRFSLVYHFIIDFNWMWIYVVDQIDHFLLLNFHLSREGERERESKSFRSNENEMISMPHLCDDNDHNDDFYDYLLHSKPFWCHFIESTSRFYFYIAIVRAERLNRL